MPGGVATAGGTKKAPAFSSVDELRDVLTHLLTEIESDSELGRRLAAAHVSYRYVFSDLDLTLDVASSDEREPAIRWSFEEQPGWKPKVTLEMDSAVANRYLQGRENLAIALVRGRIRCSCEARAALSLLPMNPQLIACYRGVLERHFPRLLLA